MTDHEAELATLHQEATQQAARIRRLTAALKVIANSEAPLGATATLAARKVALAAIQEAGQ